MIDVKPTMEPQKGSETREAARAEEKKEKRAKEKQRKEERRKDKEAKDKEETEKIRANAEAAANAS
jgi:hypothetical protein